MHSQFKNFAPLRRNVTIEDVGHAALYLSSNWAAGVTGEVHYVDAGYNVIGVPSPEGS
jgi:enoyl-[acyl-carrier protein] reductase I